MSNSGSSGKTAELLAAQYLQHHGLKLLESNYRCRFGEIDLIMRDSDVLVFIEVRLRNNARFGGAAASITPQKQQKLIRTAEHYLQANGNQACRFDAILLDDLSSSSMQWLRNAFDT